MDDSENKLRALLVEDSEDDALLLVRQLRKGGFEVEFERVQSPEGLGRALKDSRWDIILSDYNMPGFNGMAALRQVTSTGVDTPFIAVSGAIGEESAINLLKAGAVDFIKKGNWTRLVPAVKREMREAANRRKEKKERQARAKAEKRYTSLFENAVEGIFQSTPDGHFTTLNPAMARIHGYSCPREMIETVTDIKTQLYKNPHHRREFMRRLKESGTVNYFETQTMHKDGHPIWVAIHARAELNEKGDISYLEGMIEDITMRKQAEEELTRNAFYDALTGLPNRALFMDRLDRTLKRAKRRGKDYKYAVLFLDLDAFKTINDSLGHQAGDELLFAVGEAVSGCVRSVDTVARFGGDEFAILLEELESFKQVMTVCHRIQQEVARPHTIQNREVYTTASIGIVLSTKTHTRSEAILRDADIAMYRAKEEGRNRIKVYNHRMGFQAIRALELETSLRQSISREDFQVHYQPIITFASRQVTGAEALIRWNHPDKGMIQPSEFIPLAEETGLITILGQWVLTTACAQLKTWQNMSPELETMSLSVNLSARQLLQPDLVEQVRHVLEDTGVAPHLLQLEITESVLMENAQVAVSRLERLKDLGLKLAIDDFGTGYSSLAYLHQFPIDTLKIDRSFVSRMGSADRDTKVVRTIISLAHSMELEVVAEGIETSLQNDILSALGCERGQGFLMSPPVPSRDMEAILLSGKLREKPPVCT